MDCPGGHKESDKTEQLLLSFLWCSGGGGLFVKWKMSNDLTLTFSQGSTCRTKCAGVVRVQKLWKKISRRLQMTLKDSEC